MLDGLRELVELSRIDSELAQLEEERAGLPARLSACGEERVAAQERLGSAREALTEADQSQRRAEGLVQDHQAELTRLENQQHQVKSNEAYTALLSEMEHAKQAISDAETQVLEAMEAIEEARAELSKQEEQVKGVALRIDAQERDLEARGKALEAEIEELSGRRSERSGGIDPEMLARYEKIGSRRTPAVAIVSKETCLGCRVGIPPQAFIEILKGEEIVTCGSCQRILIDESQLREAGA